MVILRNSRNYLHSASLWIWLIAIDFHRFRLIEIFTENDHRSSRTIAGWLRIFILFSDRVISAVSRASFSSGIQLHEGEHRQQELSSDARRRGATSNGDICILGYSCRESFRRHITESGIVAREYATLSGKRLWERQRDGGETLLMRIGDACWLRRDCRI